MILYLLLAPIAYLPIKLILIFLSNKFGKISYDGFNALGFSYDASKDIFYTSKNAWQKNFGYSHLYDVYAPIFRMIIDTEAIRFYYNNKNYLICFWKGQYGIVTGGEVGVYATCEKIIGKNTLYLPVKEKDFLDIAFKLYKKDVEIATIEDKHWWLAIFKLGMFSKPKDLSMEISITFPNQDMLNAFLKSFKKLKHKKKDYLIEDNTFKFIYKKPKTKKVWTRSFLMDAIRQHYNRKNAILYNRYIADLIDDNMIDSKHLDGKEKLIMLNDFVPSILKNPSYITKEKIEDNEPTFKDNIIILNDSVFPSMVKKNE